MSLILSLSTSQSTNGLPNWIQEIRPGDFSPVHKPRQSSHWHTPHSGRCCLHRTLHRESGVIVEMNLNSKEQCWPVIGTNRPTPESKFTDRNLTGVSGGLGCWTWQECTLTVFPQGARMVLGVLDVAGVYAHGVSTGCPDGAWWQYAFESNEWGKSSTK